MSSSTPDQQEKARVSTRLAAAADQAQVEALAARYREEFSHAGRGMALPALGEGTLHVVLAEVEGETVGMVATHRCFAFGSGEAYLLLSDIYVAPEHRRKRVASALMEGVKQLAGQLGISAMRLFVQDINEGALITAARSGFTRSKEIVLAFNGEDA